MTIKVTTINTGWFQKEQVITVRELKSGYPFLNDWRRLKAALSEFRRCRMEETIDGGEG